MVVEGVGRIFQRAVEQGRKQRRSGAIVIWTRESGFGGDHRGGSVDGIKEDEE